MSDIDRRRYEYRRLHHDAWGPLSVGEPDGDGGYRTINGQDKHHYYHESAVRELVNALVDYGAHEHHCLLSQCRAGRPTKDGGYESLFGHGTQEKWYQRGESPPCTCGLSDIFAHYKDLK